METKSKDTEQELISYYVSIQTTLGFYRGRNDEASREDLDLFSTAILNQEVGVLKLGNNNEDMYFGEEITANSVITIHYIDTSLPF